METGKNETHINQNIGSNYGTANLAQGNIQSINNVSQNDSQEISRLVEELKILIGNEKFDDETKEEILDDLDTVKEQINDEKPKHVKLKKAYQGIKKFVEKIPDGLAKGALIVTQLGELGDKLKTFIS